MIKGVNKKVIEINNTKNIYFEKAVLYVRPEMLDTPHSHLMKEASYYLEENIPKVPENICRGRKLSKISSILMTAAVIMLILAIVVFAFLE